MMPAPAFSGSRPKVSPLLRAVTGAFVRAGLAIYFRRIERFHRERAPAEGPVLFVSNHPGSVTDAFIIGSSIPRLVHFVATVRLFRIRPVAALLWRCGVVPVNRKQDDPAAMATVEQTFAHCFDVFERGGAIGLFPEGVSYNDEQMRSVKTGAARMALEAEHRHEGRLGLRIAPVGLTYEAKGRYRSDVLVHFGEAFQPAEWLERYRADAHEAVRALTAAIDQRIRELIVDLPDVRHQRIVASVKRLYLDRLRADNRIVRAPMSTRAEELVLTQAVAQALRHFEAQEPKRLAAFVRDLQRYESRLWMAGVSDAAIADFSARDRVSSPGLLTTLALIAGAPIAFYGWLHRLAPVWFTEWAVERFSPPDNKRAQVAHGSMIAGLVGFGTVYALAAVTMGLVAGWAVAAVYLLSLPPTGLFAFHYVRALSRYTRHFRSARIMLRLPLTRRHLARLRTRLIAEIDAFRADYRRDVLRMPD